MKEKPTKLKVWWNASVAFAVVFIALALATSIGAALIAATVAYGLALFGGYRMRRRA